MIFDYVSAKINKYFLLAKSRIRYLSWQKSFEKISMPNPTLQIRISRITIIYFIIVTQIGCFFMLTVQQFLIF